MRSICSSLSSLTSTFPLGAADDVCAADGVAEGLEGDESREADDHAGSSCPCAGCSGLELMPEPPNSESSREGPSAGVCGLEVVDHAGPDEGAGSSSHIEPALPGGSGAGIEADCCRSSNVIFGNAFVSPENAGGSSHGDDDEPEEALDGVEPDPLCCIWLKSILGNARVSLLNCSAPGDAPNGESLSIEEDDGGGGGGVDDACDMLSKFIFGNARVAPLAG